MKANVATRPLGSNAARTLKELAPLIKLDLKNGDQGYIEAGYKLLEARTNYLSPTALNKKTGEVRVNLSASEATKFYGWAKDQFDRAPTQIQAYMRMAQGHEKPWKKANRARDDRTSDRAKRNATWEDLLNREFEGFDFEAFNIHIEAGLAADRKVKNMVLELMSKIISTGYHILAKKFHPDTGGAEASTEGMVRLTTAYEQLKERLK